jgi:hypothetical protein
MTTADRRALPALTAALATAALAWGVARRPPRAAPPAAAAPGLSCADAEREWAARPERFETGLRAADCFLREERPAAAEAAARGASRLSRDRGREDEARAGDALARALFARGRRAEAARAWTDAAALRPGDAGLRRSAAKGLLAAGRPREALAQARALPDRDGRGSRAADLILRAEILLALSRRDAAAADLRGAGDPAAVRAALREASRDGRERGALDLADLWVSVEREAAAADRADALVERALARAAAGETGAGADFEAAWKADPGARERRLGDFLGWLDGERGRGRSAEVLKALDRALAAGLKSPKDRAAALTARAAVKWETRDAAGAGKDFARALKADPARSCLDAPALADRGRLPEAYFAGCLKSYPDDPGLLADQGVALFKSGRKAEAEASLRRSLALDPGRLPAALSLDAVLGGGAEGRRVLRAALAKSRDAPDSALRRTAESALKDGR